MEQINQEALQRALDMALQSREPWRADQIRWMLHEHGWLFAARFSSFHLQVTQLKLKPWDRPPCRLKEPDDSPAGKLLARMLAAGMSKHDPEPLRALNDKAADSGLVSSQRRLRHPQHSNVTKISDGPITDGAA